MPKKEKNLMLNINPYLKTAVVLGIIGFISWLVFHVDTIRAEYPEKFVHVETYQEDKVLLQQQMSGIKIEQIEQRKLTQDEFTSLRKEVNEGFRETRSLIIELNKNE